ncbi:MAG: ABC transporter permease [Candidatus Aerophobetes bacterium]|nr:ABC transporter permease [Candidatus Aerophobetes bacterium]
MRRRITLFILLGILIGITVWITNLEMLKFRPPATYGELFVRISEHFKMVGFAELIAIGVGVPLGILITRPKFRKISPLVMGVVNIGQTVPSMAVVAIMAVIMGEFGFIPAVIALFIYGLLPIVRNTYAGINSIDPSIIESARGMGMSKRQIIWKIELSLARPVIMAGIRTSTVINVGTAALAALIAAGGLGMIILAGLLNNIPLLLLQGAAPTAALAIILDAILGSIEEWMTPRGLKIKRGT